MNCCPGTVTTSSIHGEASQWFIQVMELIFHSRIPLILTQSQQRILLPTGLMNTGNGKPWELGV